MRFLSLRVDWAGNVPPKPETALTLLIAAAHWALSLSVFSSILITLNYAVRRKYFPLMPIISVMVLSILFCFGISFALDHWKAVPPAHITGVQLGGKGLILSNTINRNETAVVLMEGTSNPLGPRVIAIPGQPLIFHKNASGNFDLPPVPFADDTPWFLRSLSIDIRLNAEMFQQKFSEGYLSWLFYAGSLIFLLCALGYAIKFSVWPLANLFLGTLAFCGVLALEVFLISPEMTYIIDSFLQNLMPVSLAIPLIFLGFGLLIHLYSFLVFVAKRRDNDDY